MQDFLDHIYSYKLLLSHVLSQHKVFLFCLPKRCSLSRLKKRRLRLSAPANKKIGSGSTLKVAAPEPQKWQFPCIFSVFIRKILPPGSGYILNADPDPGRKMNADPCGSGSTALSVCIIIVKINCHP